MSAKETTIPVYVETFKRTYSVETKGFCMKKSALGL